jgi:rhodanese-related sulfurtransferase
MAIPEPCGEETPCAQAELDEAQSAVDVAVLAYDEFKALIASQESFALVDARDEGSFKFGHIPGAISLPLEGLTEEKARELLDPEKLVVVYCQSSSCPISRKAAVKLLGYGFRVMDFKGGVKEWTAHGQAIEK